MGVHTGVNRLVITTQPKAFYFDLTQDVANTLKHETDSFIKHNEFLGEHTIKNKIVHYCSNKNMKTIFMNTENSKMSEPHTFVLNSSQRLDLRSSNKHDPL